MRHNQEFIGVDVGSARVGLARGSSLAKIAEPLKTVPANQAVTELINLAQQSLAVGIVVGLPRNLDGQETDQTKFVRQWVKDAQKQVRLPFYWQDEAVTSQTAQAIKNQALGIDAHAAAIILQDFLSSPESERVLV